MTEIKSIAGLRREVKRIRESNSNFGLINQLIDEAIDSLGAGLRGRQKVYEQLRQKIEARLKERTLNDEASFRESLNLSVFDWGKWIGFDDGLKEVLKLINDVASSKPKQKDELEKRIKS